MSENKVEHSQTTSDVATAVMCSTPAVSEYRRNVHEWFELTYARWLTIPRVLLDQMPIEWQHQWVKLMDEFNETWDWVPDGIQFYVNARHNGKMAELPEHLCEYRHPMFEELEKIKRHPVG